MLNKKKICVIMCVNDEDKYTKALSYLKKINIPIGMSIEYIAMRDEKSIFEAYQKAMHMSDAKYKIYMHQDVLIIDPLFLNNVIRMFKEQPRYGIIGVVGGQYFDDSGVWWNSELSGAIIDNAGGLFGERRYYKDGQVKNNQVVAVDGLLLATQYDIDWREDIFSGWHFYDTSQCLEFIRKGYKIGVIAQKNTACIHECGKMELPTAYYALKEIFLKEYQSDINLINKNNMDKYPLVSVLIPTYNNPANLVMAVDSVLAQTYPNIEIFISDNSSNEDTMLIMKEYLAKYDNIIYEYNPTFDNVENWQRIQEYNNAKTRYINYMMDDELFLPEKIKKMVSILQKNPNASVVTCDKIVLDEKYDIVTNDDIKKLYNENKCISGKIIGKRILTSNENIIGKITSALIRKYNIGESKLEFTSMEDKYMIFDYQIWLKLLSKGDMIYITEPLYCIKQCSHNYINSKSFITSVPICYVKEIKYAWDNHIFIETTEEMERCILNALAMVLDKIKQLNVVKQSDYHYEYDILRRLIITLSSALNNGYDIDLSWLDTK